MNAKWIAGLLVVFVVAGMLQGCAAIVAQAGAQPGSVELVAPIAPNPVEADAQLQWSDHLDLLYESTYLEGQSSAALKAANEASRLQYEAELQKLRGAWDHIPYADALAWADGMGLMYEVASIGAQASVESGPQRTLNANEFAPYTDEVAHNYAEESASPREFNLAAESATQVYRAGEREAHPVQAIAEVASDAQSESQKLRDSWGHSTYGNMDEVSRDDALESASPVTYNLAVERAEQFYRAGEREAHSVQDRAGVAFDAQRAALETAAERQTQIESQMVNEFMLHSAIEKAAASYPSAGNGDQIEAARIRKQQELENARQLYRAGERQSNADRASGLSAGKGAEREASRLLLKLEQSIEKAAASYPSAGNGDQIAFNKERFGPEQEYTLNHGAGLKAK